jgi:hypothetical protein
MTAPDTETRLFVSGHPPGALPQVGGGAANGRWWETDYGSWRRSAERDAMAGHFPGFRLTELLDGRLCWAGWLRSSLNEQRYLIRVTYPEAFPDQPPDVTIAHPPIPAGVPHMLGPHRPCLYLPSQGPSSGWDPACTTAATFVGWTALWIHAYETWRATGAWPGRSD